MAVELDPSFFRRCEQQQLDLRGPEGPYHPSTVLGDYHNIPVASDRHPDVELFLAAHIRYLLDTRTEPVVAIDSGGGAGLSWTRLAGVFREYIVAGQLELIVTSLCGDPKVYLDYARISKDKDFLALHGPGYKAASAKMLRRYGHLVTHMATAPDLSEGAGMQRLPYADIVHERRGGTTWSRVPETHILALGGMVVDRGVLMISGHDEGRTFANAGKIDAQEAAARLNGAEAAYKVLTSENYRLIPVTHAEAGLLAGEPLNYRVLRARQAPPITVGSHWPLPAQMVQ